LGKDDNEASDVTFVNCTETLDGNKCANSLDRQSRRQYYFGHSAQIFAQYISSRAVPPTASV
jgi:hypothetical protein